MARIGTAAGVLGVATGLWALAEPYFGGAASTGLASGLTIMGVVPAMLGIALVVSSAVSFIWRRKVFYVSALLSALLAAAVSLNAGSVSSTSFWVSIVLSVLSAGVNFVVARADTAISEQANPMNLPVFG